MFREEEKEGKEKKEEMILPICWEKEDGWFEPARRELIRLTGKEEEDKNGRGGGGGEHNFEAQNV